MIGQKVQQTWWEEGSSTGDGLVRSMPVETLSEHHADATFLVARIEQETALTIIWRDPWWTGFRTTDATGMDLPWAIDTAGHMEPEHVIAHLVQIWLKHSVLIDTGGDHLRRAWAWLSFASSCPDQTDAGYAIRDSVWHALVHLQAIGALVGVPLPTPTQPVPPDAEAVSHQSSAIRTGDHDCLLIADSR